MSIVIRMLICLGNTLVLELLAAYLCRVRNKKDLCIVALINLATNPIVTYTLTLVSVLHLQAYRTCILVFLELFAFVTEGIIYRYVKIKKPFLLSLVLNAVSYFGGQMIWRWIL